MFNTLHFTTFQLIVTIYVNAGSPFCNFTCLDQHTACYRPNCKLDTPQCGEGAEELLLSELEKEYAVHLHNNIRDLIANTRHPDLQVTGVMNMNALAYNSDLAYVAQCWANACTGGTDLCRSTSRYSDVGQNLFRITNETNTTAVLRKAVDTWFAQKEYVTPQLIKRFKYSGSEHMKEFTQLVWAETEAVGCGRTKYKDSIYLVCNYGPAGNIDSKPIFKVGKMCSSCKTECNDYYKSLCGNVEHEFTFESGIVDSVQFSYMCLAFAIFHLII